MLDTVIIPCNNNQARGHTEVYNEGRVDPLTQKGPTRPCKHLPAHREYILQPPTHIKKITQSVHA